MGQNKIRGPRKVRWRPPKKPKATKPPPDEAAWERANAKTKPKAEPKPPPPALTREEVRERMEQQWKLGRVQNAKRPAKWILRPDKWILPGGNVGYVLKKGKGDA